jgi:hypothetical protein
VTLVAILLQTVFNTEVMRYTLATGEPVITGFMRTRPSATAWAWFYAALYFLQAGWPAWAGTAAARSFFLFTSAWRDRRRRVDLLTSASRPSGLRAIVSVGRRIDGALEFLNWVLILHPRRIPRCSPPCSFPPKSGSSGNRPWWV